MPHCVCCVYSLNSGLCELCDFMSCDVCGVFCFIYGAVCVVSGCVCSLFFFVLLWMIPCACCGYALSGCCVWLYVWYAVVVSFCVVFLMLGVACVMCCVVYFCV